MTGRDYIQLQNQGSIVSNIRLLSEMDIAADMADSYGYYTKKSVALIGINSLIITSGSKVGSEAVELVDENGDESRNSPLQNAKARMQILRVLGLVSTDYGSETYAITPVGKLVLSQFRSSPPDYRLLRELFLCISSSTESYEHNCSETFNCCLGYGICYALACLDFRLSTDEMPMLTSYDISDIGDFIKEAKKNRATNRCFRNTHPHFPKTRKGTPLKNPSNITRSINQILRVCDIIKPRTVKVDGKNYYVCTEEGRTYVKEVKARFRTLSFLTASRFRKKNNIALQREICNAAYNDMLSRGGISGGQDICDTVFSPFQMLPETSAQWFLGGELRRHPESEAERIATINSLTTVRDLRISVAYNDANKLQDLRSAEFHRVRKRVLALSGKGKSASEIAVVLCEEHKGDVKQKFYPFVHVLLNIIGLDCKGEVGRYDAYCHFNEHVIPVEIKTFGEAPAYTAKGIRQAIENKIMAYNKKVPNDIDYATIVIGYEHPTNDAEARMLIELAYSCLNIKIVAADLSSLVRMAVRRVVDNKAVDLEKLLSGYGVLVD